MIITTAWWICAIGAAFIIGVVSGYFVWRRVLVWALKTHLSDPDSEFRKLLGLDAGEEWKRGTEYE